MTNEELRDAIRQDIIYALREAAVSLVTKPTALAYIQNRLDNALEALNEITLR